MPTNEERREVARELRRTARDTLNGYSFQRAVEGIVFGTIGDRTWRQTLTRLADLIEPEPERTCRNASDRDWRFICSECGLEADTDTAYGYVMSLPGGECLESPNYCPNCGRKVVER